MTATIDVPTLTASIIDQTKALLTRRNITQITMVGIHTGGVWVAEQLHSGLGISSQLGKLDISFYRDDFTRVGINPQVKPSELPLNIDDEHILLVDDVLHTGRTIRAALNELFDYGRPASITLAVLIDRGERELPIQPDIVGARMDLAAGEHIKLLGPTPLRLERTKTG